MSRDTTKPTKWVWSESSLCAQWIAKDPNCLHADSEDSDQTGLMPRLIWVIAGRTVTLLVLSCRGSNSHHRLDSKQHGMAWRIKNVSFQILASVLLMIETNTCYSLNHENVNPEKTSWVWLMAPCSTLSIYTLSKHLLAYKVAARAFIVKHTFTLLGFCYLFYEFNEELLACTVKLSIL